MELVRRVTGHLIVDVAFKHYFRPGRNAFRAQLEKNLPQMLTGRAESHVDLKQAVKELADEARNISHEELIQRVEQLAATLVA